MGYHPETLAFSFPPYARKERGFLHLLYKARPWIGVDIWHIDPERRGTGNRTDDSCGWFDRTPGEYADAVKYVTNDTSTMHEVRLALARREPMPYPFYEGISERHMTGLRLPPGEMLALTMMLAQELEVRRWWNGQRGKEGAHARRLLKVFTRKRDVAEIAASLALNPLDNLSHVESPESVVRLIAAALNRKFRPWWKHPRWHVHHWKVNFRLVRNVRRMFERCATCSKPLGFGCSPHDPGNGTLHHGACLGHGMASAGGE